MLGSSGETYNPAIFNAWTRSSVSVMVWGCIIIISIHGLGQLVVVEGTMNQSVYIDTLKDNATRSCHKAHNVER
jgi:hypothetical protein